MASALAPLALALALGSPGAGPAHAHGPVPSHYPHPGRILPPGPGYGWGFPNGSPDGYGWYDVGTCLPLGADRTPEYFFPRYLAIPGSQLFLPSYFNPYVTRGQRYLPYTGCGGMHPAGGPPSGTGALPVHPYREGAAAGPVTPLPTFSGRIEASPITPGGSGLVP
ncbi:MAG TPA: hypothetical protein VF590_21600 [Isosphaeraceae bacterium]|jgi:hypothetical protein